MVILAAPHCALSARSLGSLAPTSAAASSCLTVARSPFLVEDSTGGGRGPGEPISGRPTSGVLDRFPSCRGKEVHPLNRDRQLPRLSSRPDLPRMPRPIGALSSLGRLDHLRRPCIVGAMSAI